MSELKPCPFCGGKAIISTFDPFDDIENTPLDMIDYEVTCENERCINGWWLTPEQWQTRPIEDALRARAEKAEAMVELLIELGDVINGDKDSVWTLRTIKERWTIEVAKWKERE